MAGGWLDLGAKRKKAGAHRAACPPQVTAELLSSSISCRLGQRCQAPTELDGLSMLHVLHLHKGLQKEGPVRG